MNMKNMLKYFALLVFIISFSCNRNGGLEVERQAREFKRYVSEEPFSHILSLNYNSNWTVFRVTNPSAIYALGYCGLYFQSSPNKQEFGLIASTLEDYSVYRVNFQNAKDIFVPNFKMQCAVNRFPIPKLDDPFFNIKDNVDIENSVILGLSQKRGNFFTDKGISEAEKFAEPQDYDKIGNGYSNGAIIDYSSKKIFYWIIIW
jgi:hypothetical protein